MTTSNQIHPGMILQIGSKLYRVESSVKVTVPKGNPFIKTKLRDLATEKGVERNFKLNQKVEAVTPSEKSLEFLYPEGAGYLFLDVGSLDQVLVPEGVVGETIEFLKEGIELKASFYGDRAFSVELPQFLELMVVETEGEGLGAAMGEAAKMAELETGAKIEVPPFIEVGDVVKVDTRNKEFVQRV